MQYIHVLARHVDHGYYNHIDARFGLALRALYVVEEPRATSIHHHWTPAVGGGQSPRSHLLGSALPHKQARRKRVGQTQLRQTTRKKQRPYGVASPAKRQPTARLTANKLPTQRPRCWLPACR